jgi:rSAM/selenodomain-associated transferase 1
MTLSVALFAKPPRPGAVKTRLSPSLPATEAALLFQAFLSDAAARVRAQPRARRILYLAEGLAEGEADDWASGFDEVRLQAGADLGERMARAFDEMLPAPGNRAVVIGADSPDLPADTLPRAAEALDRCDLVLGPARDGGYYLVGLSRRAPELFRGVTWGGAEVFAESMEHARRLGLHAETLPPWWDVDEPADLVALIGRMLGEDSARRAPATARALVELGFLPAGRV